MLTVKKILTDNKPNQFSNLNDNIIFQYSLFALLLITTSVQSWFSNGLQSFAYHNTRQSSALKPMCFRFRYLEASSLHLSMSLSILRNIAYYIDWTVEPPLLNHIHPANARYATSQRPPSRNSLPSQKPRRFRAQKNIFQLSSDMSILMEINFELRYTHALSTTRRSARRKPAAGKSARRAKQKLKSNKSGVGENICVESFNEMKIKFDDFR